LNACACITFDAFPLCTANTLVTFGTNAGFPTPAGTRKHAPVTIRFCNTAQLPSLGVTLNTTGALTPKSRLHTVVLVNGPNTLLSPALKVVVTVNAAIPPQHVAGNPLPGRLIPELTPGGLIVPLTRLQFNGVTPVNAMTASGTPLPSASQASVAAVETVFPPRCNGTPVSPAPAQITVVSFGKNPHPMMFNCTEHTALIIPAVADAALDPPDPVPGVPAAAVPTAG
jgi:hypothetical protein